MTASGTAEGAEGAEGAGGPDLATLDRTWDQRPGFTGWLGQCNHKAVGRRFIVTTMVMFLFAGVLALVMRVQLAVPEADVLSPEVYNQFFTMHGTMMMFLFVVPMLEGLAIYFLPLQLGARDMPLPRLNAFGYWAYLGGALLLLSSFFFGTVPDGGWYAYVPLTTSEFSPGLALDFWLLGVTFVEISAIVAAIEIIVLILRSRAPGMTLARMPVFAWANLVTSGMILAAFPPLVAASLLLEVERKLGTAFFDAARGGDPLLWQHLFWWFGHPEVYIQLLPALGILASVLPAATRRRLPARWLVVASFIAIGIVSFALWVHHMFTTGIPNLVLQFFSSASFMITIPTAIIVFAFVAAIWTGRGIRWDPPTLFAVGFLVIFVLGGISGVMVAVVGFNWQSHDTYFVVAHFHYVLVGGSVFPIFAGLYHWFPKLTGRHVSRRAGQWAFWLMFLGFNTTFMPQHVLGFLGMPRRVWTYEDGLGWTIWNLVSTIGSGFLGLGVAISVAAFAVAWQRGPAADRDPWLAPTLEWAVPSPPPNENFALLPVVDDPEPRWSAGSRPHPSEAADWYVELGHPPEGQREAVITSVAHGRPQATVVLPGHSLWPLWLTAAILVGLIGVLLDVYVLAVAGVVGVAVTIAGWLWPATEADARPVGPPDGEEAWASASEPPPPDTRPQPGSVLGLDGSRGARPIAPGGASIGWWGAVLGLLAIAHLVAGAWVAAIYLRSRVATWPPSAVDPPGLGVGGLAVAAMVLAAVLAVVAGIRTSRGRTLAFPLLAIAALAALAAAGLRGATTIFSDHPVTDEAYWSIRWFLGALDVVLATAAAGVLALSSVHVRRGVFLTGRHAELGVAALWTGVTAALVTGTFVVQLATSVWWG
jgi:cytochrome c oxidase subunit I+III